jgi:hypothetical protein
MLPCAAQREGYVTATMASARPKTTPQKTLSGETVPGCCVAADETSFALSGVLMMVWG